MNSKTKLGKAVREACEELKQLNDLVRGRAARRMCRTPGAALLHACGR